MAVTVSDLIHSSFRLIGAIAAGENLETAELNDAFVSLNQLISSWNTEGLSLAGRWRWTLNLFVNQNTYALPNRPVKVDAASVSISNIDCPLEIVDAAGWEAVTEKAESSVFIRKFYCDYMFPVTTVYIWPSPRVPGTLEMFLLAPISLFETLDQTLNFPPGYEAALRYNLAVALLPEYPRSQVDPTLPAQAQNYKASLVQLNASNHQRTVQPTATTVAAQGGS
jgi:hypothetical protein